ncbi:MAG: MFS transporter [Bacilli bacterium]|nr:MFS transporter [Bacilli bacterium]MBN2697007.1 MFS transporter [Bacilli bacterium]
MEQIKADTKNKTSLGFKNWMLIWIVGMAGQIAWNIENSWFNSFVYEKIGYRPEIIAWMVGVSAAVTTVVTFVFGTLSDRIGKRKPFIVIGYFFWGIATVFFGLTELIFHSLLLEGISTAFGIAAFLVVLADALMSGFGSVGNDAGFNAWTTDISNETNRGRLGGAIAIMPVFATIIGTIGSGFIIAKFDYFGFFIIMGILVMSISVLSQVLLKDNKELKPRKEGSFWKQFLSIFDWEHVRSNKELFLVFVFMATYFIGFNVYFPYILVYLQYTLEIPVEQSGVILGAGLIVASVIVLPAAILIDRKHPVLVCLLAIFSNTIGLIVVSSTTAIPVLVLGIFLVGIGYIAVVQALTAWMKNLYPRESRGQFEGMRIVFAVLVPMVIGPGIGSFVINKFGPWGTQQITDTIFIDGPLPPALLFIVSAVLTLVSLAPLYFLAQTHKKRTKILSGTNEA